MKTIRTLIYKRTHSGDPDPVRGLFGNHNCMGTVRGWAYDAVIGIGGIGPEPNRNRIAGKLTWIGIGPHKVFDDPTKPRSPRVTFDHFRYYGERGPLLEVVYPMLARRMYKRNVRVLIHSAGRSTSYQTVELDSDVEKILQLAKRSPSSSNLHRREELLPATKCGRGRSIASLAIPTCAAPRRRRKRLECQQPARTAASKS